MPLVLQTNGYSAWIKVDDKKLDQYNVEILNHGKTATCWIASEVGKRFTVNWSSLTPHSTTLSGLVTVDGIKCGGKIMYPSSKATNIRKSGFSTSSTTIRPFSFAPLQLTDDDSVLDYSASKDLGEICIEIWRIKVIGIQNKLISAPLEQKVHERSKKATSHRVKLDDEETRSHRNSRTSQRLDKEPLMTFVFKYRPIEMLQANGIAPLDNPKKRQAPQHSVGRVKTEHRDVIDVDEDEKAQRTNALEDELEVLKGQTSRSQDARPAKRVKREPQARPIFVPGEIIDLT